MKESFKDIINGNQLVLVDFYADWCAPCRTQAPILKELANEIRGRARVIKINVDRNQPIAQHYQVQSIPTLVLFKKGKTVWKQSGVASKQQLLSVISQYLWYDQKQGKEVWADAIEDKHSSTWMSIMKKQTAWTGLSWIATPFSPLYTSTPLRVIIIERLQNYDAKDEIKTAYFWIEILVYLWSKYAIPQLPVRPPDRRIRLTMNKKKSRFRKSDSDDIFFDFNFWF